MRLLAERTGLTGGVVGGDDPRGFTPLYDRGQLLVDLAVTQLLGGEAISDFQGLRHLAPVIGPIPSNPTVWRAWPRSASCSWPGSTRRDRVPAALVGTARRPARAGSRG